MVEEKERGFALWRTRLVGLGRFAEREQWPPGSAARFSQIASKTDDSSNSICIVDLLTLYIYIYDDNFSSQKNQGSRKISYCLARRPSCAVGSSQPFVAALDSTWLLYWLFSAIGSSVTISLYLIKNGNLSSPSTSSIMLSLCLFYFF